MFRLPDYVEEHRLAEEEAQRWGEIEYPEASISFRWNNYRRKLQFFK